MKEEEEEEEEDMLHNKNDTPGNRLRLRWSHHSRS